MDLCTNAQHDETFDDSRLLDSRRLNRRIAPNGGPVSIRRVIEGTTPVKADPVGDIYWVVVYPVTNENAAVFTAALGNSLLNRLAGGSRALTATDAVVALRGDIHRFGKIGKISVRAAERTRRTIWKGDKDQPKHH